MASVNQIDWVAIKLEAQAAVERAEAAVLFTENQLRGFEAAKMNKAAKKYHLRLSRQRAALAEAKAVLAEVSAR